MGKGVLLKRTPGCFLFSFCVWALVEVMTKSAKREGKGEGGEGKRGICPKRKGRCSLSWVVGCMIGAEVGRCLSTYLPHR